MGRALLIGAVLFLVGCGPQAAAHPAPATPSVTAVEASTTPSPQLTPREARVDLRLAWEKKTSSLGDVSESLVVTISSNIPMSFLIYPGGVVYRGQNIDSSGVSIGFVINRYESKEWRLDFPARAPAGQYSVIFDVPSYTYLSTQQDSAYTAWVGGDQGKLLAGNPQAVHDPNHPAVLNLRATAAISQ